MRRSTPSRSRLAIIVIAAFAVALPAIAMPAQAAAPAPTKKIYPTKQEIAAAKKAAQSKAGQVKALSAAVAAADTKLSGLTLQLQIATQAYSDALASLDQAKAVADDAAARAAIARAELAKSQGELAAFASAAYRSGGDLARVDAFLSADGPGTVMDQASTMDVIGDHQSTALDRVTIARIAADASQSVANASLAKVQTATSLVHQTKLAAEGAVANQKAESASLRVRRTALNKQLDALTARSAALKKARADGIAAEIARQRANSGGNDESVPPGIALGMPVNVPEGHQRGTTEGAAKAIAYAKKQLGKPYLYAADGPDSFDCSGLTMMAWRQGGVDLVHWSVAQYANAKKINMADMRPGDLIFYANDPTDYRTIHHVTMYVGGGKMIEAPHTGSWVRIIPIYSQGLFGAARP